MTLSSVGEPKIAPSALSRAEEVQKIIHQHFLMIQRFYTVTKEIYIGLTKLYVQHPDCKKFFDVYHPNMIEFIGKAMRVYANKHL